MGLCILTLIHILISLAGIVRDSSSSADGSPGNNFKGERHFFW